MPEDVRFIAFVEPATILVQKKSISVIMAGPISYFYVARNFMYVNAAPVELVRVI